MIVQVIYFHKIQTKLFQMQVFTVNSYKQLSLMSVNGKYDVIKGPVLPPCMEISKLNVLRQDFWQDFCLRENNC